MLKISSFTQHTFNLWKSLPHNVTKAKLLLRFNKDQIHVHNQEKMQVRRLVKIKIIKAMNSQIIN